MKGFSRSTVGLLCAATILGAVGAASAQGVYWGGGPCGGGMMYGPMMGQGMGPGMMGPGMMGPGMMMGTGMMGQPGQGVAVTVENVQSMIELSLQMQGNPNLKVGSVSESDGVIIAEIVTKDGSLVDRFRIDPSTGQWMPSN